MASSTNTNMPPDQSRHHFGHPRAAYDIFGYFCKLDSGEALTSNIRDHLDELYKKHRDDVVKRVLSLRTQSYMNTHRSKTSVEQSICSVLEIQYRPRLMLAESRTV